MGRRAGAGATLSASGWPAADWIGRHARLPAGLRLRQLGHADVPRVIAEIGAWSPDLAVGEERVLLTREFYDAEVALAGAGPSVEDRPVLVLLLESEGTLVGYWAGEFDASERTIVGRMALVAPDARGRGCGRALLDTHLAVGRGVGADLAFGFVDLDNQAQCALLERAGFVLCGVLPNSEVRYVAPGIARHVPEAFYVYRYDSAPELLWPEPHALAPRTTALVKLLFDRGEPREGPESSATGIVPELDPGIAARLAARPGGVDAWPDVALLAPQCGLPPGLTLRQLARRDLPTLTSVLPTWLPELAGSSREGLLTQAPYEDSVALTAEDVSVARRPVYGFLIESSAEPMGFGLVDYRASQTLLRGEIVAVAPHARRLGLGVILATLPVLLARAIGADMIIAWITLRHPYAQQTAERAGYRLVGIVPGSDRVQLAPGVVKHVCEAVYAISLVTEERTFRPPSASLSPRMAALARFILGAERDER